MLEMALYQYRYMLLTPGIALQHNAFVFDVAPQPDITDVGRTVTSLRSG